MSRTVLAVTLAWILVLCASLLGTPGITLAQKPYLPEEIFADLARQSTRAVVNISTERVLKTHFGQQPQSMQRFFEQFFGPLPRTEKIHSLGSGIIIDPKGYVVTNNHVVEGAQEIKITLAGGDEFNATVKGRDPETDLALVHIVDPPPDLPFLKLGDSDAVSIGDWVMAVGNPFGLSHSVTQGIISAKGRLIGDTPYDRFLQTDTSINPGNSGGPLLNLKGEVIGINTAILTSGQGIGFAVPSNTAKHIVPILKEKGKVTRGMIGVLAETVTRRVARKLKLAHPGGALVVKVNPDTPAQKAGLEAGDIIVGFNGHPVRTMIELLDLVGNTPPGTEATVTVQRQGHEKKFKLKVAELQEEHRLKPERHLSWDSWKDLLFGVFATTEESGPPRWQL
jgi:serine protease Do